MRWTPQSLAAAAGGRLVRSSSRPIATVFYDSRRPRLDALFVPLVAARDGHEFVTDAIRGGASAVLMQVGRPLPAGDVTIVEVEDTLVGLTRLAQVARHSIAGPVVAITGSNGKTTTRAFVEAVLASAFAPVLCTRGNLNNHIGVPVTLLDEPHDPAAAVIELGMSAPGENDHLASIVEPDIHVLTSIALEHLEFMGSIEAIAAAEAEPIARIRTGGALVVPADEPLLGPHLAAAPAGLRVIRFGPSGSGADVEIVEVEVAALTRVILRLGTHDHELILRTFGAHNARNAAAALAVAVHLGIPIGPAISGLEAVEPVGDRGRVHEFGPHLLIADCYNANPGSMAAALDSFARLRQVRKGPLVAVLGDMLELGPDEAALHAELGDRAAMLGLDALIGVGPRAIHAVAAARRRGTSAEAFDLDAIDEVAGWLHSRFATAEPGAILFKASRGVRLERVVAKLLEVGPA